MPSWRLQTCSDLINQHSKGNSHCLLHCLSHLTGNSEGNNCMHTLQESPLFKGTAISCHPKPTRDWHAVRTTCLAPKESVYQESTAITDTGKTPQPGTVVWQVSTQKIPLMTSQQLQVQKQTQNCLCISSAFYMLSPPSGRLCPGLRCATKKSRLKQRAHIVGGQMHQ